MKGIVFSEFIEMVEEKFSPGMADEIITSCTSKLESAGSYTSVGVYDHQELVELVTALSQRTGVAVGTLVSTFGKHLAGRFCEIYPAFFKGLEGTIDFLESVDNHIHVEVLKLYPDAELPRFKTVREGEKLIMEYQSSRPFAMLARGLIEGSAAHFGEILRVEEEDLSAGAGNHMRFTITPQRHP
jgi:hypothetical protein